MAAAKRYYVSGVGGLYDVRDRRPHRGAINGVVSCLDKYKDAREYARRLNDLYAETARDQLPAWDFVKRLPTNDAYMRAACEKLIFTYAVDGDDIEDGDAGEISPSADGAWVPVRIWVPARDAMVDAEDAGAGGGEDLAISKGRR